MSANSYAGMVQPEIPRLIVSRARRYRVSADEIEDLQQQIVPLLAEFRFDPARANGASVTTAMTAIIDRQIKAHLRTKRRYQQRVERLQAMAGDPAVSDAVTPAQVAQSAPVDLRLDIERSMAQLSPRDREICQGLSHGLNVTAIAQRLGCGRDTVDRAIVRIRRAFDAAGMRAWVDADACAQGRVQQ